MPETCCRKYLIKNLDQSKNDCYFSTYWILTEEFGSKNLDDLKQKGAYLYEYLDSLKRFNKEK